MGNSNSIVITGTWNLSDHVKMEFYKRLYKLDGKPGTYAYPDDSDIRDIARDIYNTLSKHYKGLHTTVVNKLVLRTLKEGYRDGVIVDLEEEYDDSELDEYLLERSYYWYENYYVSDED